MTEGILNDLIAEADRLERRLMSLDLTATRIGADDIAPTLADLRALRNEAGGWRADDATVIKRFHARLAAIEAAQPAFSVPQVLAYDEPRAGRSFPPGHPFH